MGERLDKAADGPASICLAASKASLSVQRISRTAEQSAAAFDQIEVLVMQLMQAQKRLPGAAET